MQLIPTYREEAKKLEEKVQAFDKLKDMEQRVGDLEKELHWAIVFEIESVRTIRALTVYFIACYNIAYCALSNLNPNSLSCLNGQTLATICEFTKIKYIL